MNRKGFTLIELLGVIVILSIIMLIAIPNISSVLDKNKKQNYITDAKKLITQVKYEIRSGRVEKPSDTNLVRINLSYIATDDISKDVDGNSYDVDNSYVVIARKDGYLVYYVNLIANNGDENIGIKLTEEENLSKENKLSLVEKNFTAPTDEEIKQITAINGDIKKY